MVPDVTGTEQHTGQMFVVDTCSKNRICMATKRNIKHEGASKWPIYIQITVSLRLCRALLSTNGQGKPRRPGGLESAQPLLQGESRESCKQFQVLLGKLIRCTECWKTAGRITIRQTVMQSTYSKYDSKKETILQGRTKTYKLNIQQRYIWVADQESCCRQSTKFTWCRSTDKKMKSVDVSQERGNKSGPKDKAQRMGAPRPSLT